MYVSNAELDLRSQEILNRRTLFQSISLRMLTNRTIKCLKRLKRSIDDNLRQLVLITQDRVLLN